MLHSIRISDEALQLLKKHRHIGQSYDGFIKELLQEHGFPALQGDTVPLAGDKPSGVEVASVKE